jgi:exodeoxyribonuclease-3
LKAAEGDFPEVALSKAGYSAEWVGQKTWNGVAILARDAKVIVTRRRLPGDPDDEQSWYVEAAVDGVLVACIYAPNGNPQPGPKFDYKLAWLKRLNAHSDKLLKSGAPAVIAGDFNVVPTLADIYPTKSWDKDALVQPEGRTLFAKLPKKGRPTRCASCIPTSPCIRSGRIGETATNGAPVSASIICCSVPRCEVG